MREAGRVPTTVSPLGALPARGLPALLRCSETGTKPPGLGRHWGAWARAALHSPIGVEPGRPPRQRESWRRRARGYRHRGRALESCCAGTGAQGSGCSGWAGFLFCSGGRCGSAPPGAASAAAVAAAPGRLLLLLLHRGPLRPAAPGFLLPASGNCERKKKKKEKRRPAQRPAAAAPALPSSSKPPRCSCGSACRGRAAAGAGGGARRRGLRWAERSCGCGAWAPPSPPAGEGPGSVRSRPPPAAAG